MATNLSEAGPSLDRPELYINRELSAVAFIRRVLDEAAPERHPLLECIKFIGIVSSLLDDFIMIRVAGLKDQQIAQVLDVGPDGMLPGEQVEALHSEIQDVLDEQNRCLNKELLPALAELGVVVLEHDELTRAQSAAAGKYFREQIFPVLTPLGVDPGHPFPLISNRSLNLAVVLRDLDGEDLFARVKVPSTLRRLVRVPLNGRAAGKTSGPQRYAFVWLEQVIAAHLDQLFPGMEVVASYPFHVLRDADFEIQRDEAGDLLTTVEHGVRQRKFGSVVSLAVRADMPAAVRDLLCDNLEIDPSDVYALDGPLGLAGITELTEVDRPDLKDQPLVPRVPAELRMGRDPFAAIQRGDMLLHHPYDTFSSVAEFIQAAARDPQVLAIKQTLYRVGVNSPIVQALLEANRLGKQVAVLVELKARFDEENNIEWARTLEKEGVHVVYGQIDLKTHAKVALVVRRERDTLRRYVHLGTGNYNASTARIYEDYALLTCNPELGADASNLFNALTGYARHVHYNKLLVAPDTLRPGLLMRIEREIKQHVISGKGHLIFKVNALVDPEIIRALYRASQAGVRVDLLVRGVCCLRPGVHGVSDHIHVRSIVGRQLEHSRIFYFANGGLDDDELYLGSADLMQRNLDHRVETLFPILDPTLRRTLRDVEIPQYFRDTVNARELRPNGTYARVQPHDGEAPFDEQAWFAHTGGLRAEDGAPRPLWLDRARATSAP
ncbi:MAG TPA: polyphosphate kinase 1 [Ktedonobacterales bacterium]|nr:polyphosphate kinase 1 [Ktedonobacterales bacterium]